MANADTYGYKTGTFITKKVFKFVFNFEYSVYMNIYDVPQLSSCHWELTSWHFDWDLVSYFHILAEGKYYYLRFLLLLMKVWNQISVKRPWSSLRNWLNSLSWISWAEFKLFIFQLKEIWPLFSPTKAKKPRSFFTSLDESMKPNLSQKAMWPKVSEIWVVAIWIMPAHTGTKLAHL